MEPCCQLLSIKGELFDTFRKRHHGSELADVKLTTESLHRCIHILLFVIVIVQYDINGVDAVMKCSCFSDMYLCKSTSNIFF